MIKTLALVTGVVGAVAASQYPAFTQQYIQRLGGQVDALTKVVMDFDRSAVEAGLGREEALQQMVGTPFLEARQVDMRGTFARHIALTEHLEVLRAATPLERMVMPHRIADEETLAATWADFSPAMPVTRAGAMSAGLGGFLGYAGTLMLLSPIGAMFRRKPKQQGRAYSEPKVSPRIVEPTQSRLPRLMGETR